MDNINQIEKEQLILSFKSCSEFHFRNRFQEHKSLFFDVVPFAKWGEKNRVELVSVTFEWKDVPTINREIHQGIDSRTGEEKYIFKQNCFVNYSLKINSILCPPIENKQLTFVTSAFKPLGLTFSPSFHESKHEILESLRDSKIAIKQKLNLLHIDEEEYQLSTGAGFYTDIVRKRRTTNASNQNIIHLNYYYEIANCHWQIEDCLLKAIHYFRYSSDFLTNRIDQGDNPIFIPTINNYDNQYLFYIGFGLERVYSFGDRMTILLYNFNPLGQSPKNLSFNSYMQKLQKVDSCNLNRTSQHFIWLSEFFENSFKQMVEYRHRVVHFQFTNDWAGVLTAKFSSNTQGNMMNEERLKELKLEFEWLLKLLHENYLFCKDGFINVLKLIDEIK